MAESVLAYIALGSNLGDRRALLEDAVARLRGQPGLEVIKVSSFHETEPVGGPEDQGKYLNAALALRTTLAPIQLLRILLAIEAQMGRVRGERFGPRPIDLDLLLHGSTGANIKEADVELVLPHPRMHERSFVLEPLVEIAPLAVHPVLQSTAKDLLDRLTQAPHAQHVCRELEGQNAVVTGSTSGIGRAIALALAEAGANVIIHGRRSFDRAEAVAAQCVQWHVEAPCILADLREESECEGLVDFAWELWPVGIDIWINNAGADTLTGDASSWSFERKLQELWAVDVRATMQLGRWAGDRMKRQGRGAMVNMGWDQSATGMAGDSGQLFGAAKGAVMAFTKSLALSLAPEVRVNCLAPGWIRTAWLEQASDTWQKRAAAEAPLARSGTPEEVAQAARWLVSPAAQFITGQILRVDGGAVRA